MLQILRYTPSFLPGLASLKDEITALEEALDKADDDDADSLLSVDTRRTWRVVKDIYWMYHRMEQKEVWCLSKQTSNSSHMAVRPSTVLNSIRELNPMFEGNFQHDAQELLRCLLCYMEDAERDVRKLKDKALGNTTTGTGKSLFMDSEGKAVKLSQNTSTVSRKTDDIKVEFEGAGGEEESREDNSEKGGQETEGDSSVQRNGPEKPRKQFKLKGGAPPSRTARKKTALLKQNGAVVTVLDDIYLKKEEGLNGHGVSGSEMNGFGEEGKPSVVSKTGRGVKRKRSRSRSTNKQAKSEDCVDGGYPAETVGEIKPKEESTPLSVVFRKGMAATKKKIEGNGQTIVGFFRNVRDKLIPGTESASEPVGLTEKDEKPSAKTKSSNKDDVSIGKKLLQPNHGRRLGMTGFVVKQSKLILGACQDKAQKTDEKDAGCDSIIIEDDEDCLISFSNSCCEVKEVKQKENGKISPLATLNFPGLNQAKSPCRKSAGLSAVNGTPTCVKSPHSLEDEILPAVEPELGLDIESTISSVTKKYYSSLSRSELSWPTVSRFPEERPSSPKTDTKSSDSKDISGEPSENAEQKHASSPCGKFPSSSSVCSLTPGRDIIIHSPYKAEDGGSVCSNDAKALKAVKALDFELTENLSDSLSPARSKTQGVASESDVNFMDFSPKSARHLSDSQTVDELNLDQNGVSTRSIKSTPNSLYSSPGKTKSRLLAKVSNTERKAANSCKDIFVSSNCGGETELAPVKIELKRCDWLGVSPVKSVSASSVLMNLRLHEEQSASVTDKGALRAKRNILNDLDLFDISKSVSQKSDEKSKSNPVSEPDKVQQSMNESYQSPDLCVETSSGPSCAGDAHPRLQKKSRRRISSRILNRHQDCEINNLSSPKCTQPIKERMKESTKTVSEKKGSVQSAYRDIRTMMLQPQGSNSKQQAVSQEVSCPPGLKLKGLSVSVDKCDWMLGSPVPPLCHAPPVTAIQRKKMVNGKIRVKRFRSKAGGDKDIGMTSATSLGVAQKHQDGQSDAKDAENCKSTCPLIERLFGGTMVHLTRCLECERSRDRKESFLDISIAVKHLEENNDSDEEKDEDEGSAPVKVKQSSCLASLIRSSSSVERLRDSNKYWCEQCLHLVEAERSSHYLDLPWILSLQLKRFSTNSGLFGGLSKLNDKVDIPEELPCMRHGCGNSCKNPSHRYQLFALATHSGTSILHGHYRAFVKVQPWVSPAVFHNLVSYHTGGSGGNCGDDANATCAAEPELSPCTVPAVPSASPGGTSQIHQAGPVSFKSEEVFSPVPSEDKPGSEDALKSLSSSAAATPSLGTESAKVDGVSSTDRPGFFSRRITDFFGSNSSASAGKTHSPGTRESSRDFTAVSSSGESLTVTSKNKPSLSSLSHKSKKISTSNSCSPAGDRRNLHKMCLSTRTENGFDGPDISNICDKGGKICYDDTERVESADVKVPGCFWLECDDECVRVMDEDEFGKKLREEEGALLGTPYLLFYHAQWLRSSFS
ncbi:hypothetical protein EGW08_020490 [Elysia chlorotica]|uniref:USP domain-containing protein n=1 Tax=Elysia chlorotica TaxID=188477 RepID=A0A3S1AYQ9_ELYCH|nr:hypothetical protein EGW08_020490 [Elysia chlorotica]